MKKLFFENLPKRSNGQILWNKSIGMYIDFVYESVSGKLQIIDYNTFNSTNYVTIEVNEYEFLANAMTFDNKLTYYCLDKRSGKLLTNQIIMKQENLSADTIRTKIYDHIKDNNEIDIDVTMNNPYTLYYNEYGKVKANIIVKIGDINYNDNVEIN